MASVTTKRTVKKLTKKDKAKKKALAQDMEKVAIAALVDDYVLVAARVEQLNADPAHEALKDIKTDIQKRGEKYDADLKVVLDGTHGRKLVLGPRAKERTVISPKKALVALKKAVGPEKVWELVKVGLGMLDTYLTPDEVAKLVKQEQTGKRSIKVIGTEE